MPGKSVGRKPQRRARNAARVASTPRPSALTHVIAAKATGLTARACAHAAPSAAAPAREVAPEVVEVEPVVGPAATLRLQPLCIARDHGADRVVATRARQACTVGERLENDLITPAADMEPEAQQDGRLEQRRDHEGTSGKLRRRAQEVDR